jgi:hypothetical protein
MQCGHTQPRSGEGERAGDEVGCAPSPLGGWGYPHPLAVEPDTADEVACVPTPSDNQIVSFSRSTG